MNLRLKSVYRLILSLSLGPVMTISSSAYAGLFPKVVDSLELKSFLGRWYEIASTDPEDCVCTTADYAPIDDETFSVTSICRKKTVDGRLDIMEGKARVTNNPGKIKLTFDGDHFPFFSNYWVVDLADDYRYAVVTTGLKKPVRILARTQRLNQEDMGGILERLHRDYYNLVKLRLTPQSECLYTSEPTLPN